MPVKVWAHISLVDLMGLDGSSALLRQWVTDARAAWARTPGEWVGRWRGRRCLADG